MSDGSDPTDPGRPVRRPLLERLGLAALAGTLATLFAAMGAGAWVGGEIFLAAMAWIGALMTVWAAGSSLRGR